ncbi:hypothetical protein HII31_13549 [Pseudocercospora fuligena]|uniref:Uncharacterized protein n=1 Tax=Pseudocercospora fuligena TaxID=685502 RepID=A0A8H6R501_9PEZI|nr:hypothetical protein HII31_13549 [Pseudocercospora fuligena]
MNNTTQPTESDLSGAASTFTPETTEPPPDASSVEQFSQTGPQQDDLFNEVVPAEESMRIRSDDDLFSEDFTPAAQPVVVPQTQSTRPQQPRSAPDSARGRGRGRGRGRNAHEARDTTERNETTSSGRQPQNPRNTRPQQPAQPQSTPPENAPSGPRKETPQAVRGDRSAAGGLRKPKLTEEELAEKMARIQIKNASLTAAHARAEADAASFAEREQQAKQIAEQRKKEERRDRQQMMGEREKNRQRKLKAMEGREWDAEKREDDFGKGGRFDKKGGYKWSFWRFLGRADGIFRGSIAIDVHSLGSIKDRLSLFSRA